jgi:hypothetical protein
VKKGWSSSGSQGGVGRALQRLQGDEEPLN